MDARAVYTRKRLKDSYIELMKDRNYSQITAKEICEMADVNRTTFYAHFKSQNNLLEAIEKELIQNLSMSISKAGAGTIQGIFKAILFDVKENFEVYRALLSDNGDIRFKEKLLDVCYMYIKVVMHAQNPNISEEIQSWMFRYIMEGAVGVITEWVETGKERPIDDVLWFLDRTVSAIVVQSAGIFPGLSMSNGIYTDAMPVRRYIYRTGGLCVDDGARVVTVDGKEANLTNTEYEMLLYLIKKVGITVTSEELCNAVWGDSRYQIENNLAVYICRIRKKIEADTKNPKYLKVVWGVGYRLIDYNVNDGKMILIDCERSATV